MIAVAPEKAKYNRLSALTSRANALTQITWLIRLTATKRVQSLDVAAAYSVLV
jgi:hypothetical protein